MSIQRIITPDLQDNTAATSRNLPDGLIEKIIMRKETELEKNHPSMSIFQLPLLRCPKTAHVRIFLEGNRYQGNKDQSRASGNWCPAVSQSVRTHTAGSLGAPAFQRDGDKNGCSRQEQVTPPSSVLGHYITIDLFLKILCTHHTSRPCFVDLNNTPFFQSNRLFICNCGNPQVSWGQQDKGNNRLWDRQPWVECIGFQRTKESPQLHTSFAGKRGLRYQPLPSSGHIRAAAQEDQEHQGKGKWTGRNHLSTHRASKRSS